MTTTRRPTAAQRARHAAASAALVRRVVEEACNQGDLAILDELLATTTPVGPLDPLGRLSALLAAFRAAVPDARWAILELVAEGETVVTRLEVRGRFSGPLVGLAPPGRPATLTGVAISRFAAGRLVGLWLQADLLGLLEQLGVLPPLGLAQAVTMAQVRRAGAALADEPARRASLSRDDGSE
jgi:predicted ester cyclase